MIQLYTQKTSFDQKDFLKMMVETEKRYDIFVSYSISISKNCELLGELTHVKIISGVGFSSAKNREAV